MAVHAVRIGYLKQMIQLDMDLIREYEEQNWKNMNALMTMTNYAIIKELSDNIRQKRKTIDRLKKGIESYKKELSILEKSGS